MISVKKHKRNIKQTRIGIFPKNMQHLQDIDKEIIRSVLNNGFFTIAHNWKSDDKEKFIKVFTELKANKEFLDKLEEMFNKLGVYEEDDFEDEYSDETGEEDDYLAEDQSSDLWEEMGDISKDLDKIAKQSGLIKRMAKYINW